jgi:hypothetical protein
MCARRAICMGGLASRSRVVSFVRMPCAWWHGREDEMSACPHVSRVWCLVKSMSAPGPAAAARVENRDVRSGRARATGAGARTRRARGAAGGVCSVGRRRLFVLYLYFNGKGGRQRRPPARPHARKQVTKVPEVVTRTRRRCDRRRTRSRAKPRRRYGPGSDRPYCVRRVLLH